MDGNMPPGNPGTDDYAMTNASNGAGNIFDTMLAEIDADWGNADAQDVFMMDQVNDLDPAIFDSLSPLTNDSTGTASVPRYANYQDVQTLDAIFGITSSPTPRAQSAGASTTPRRERTTAALLSSSPTSSTPAHSPRGHYGSARRRRAIPTNFQPIVPSPRGQAVQSSVNGGLFEPFEAIPEHQQGIVGPEYFNENIPEFRPREIELEPSRTDYNRINIPAVEGGFGGYDSQATESGTALTGMQNALQFPNKIPVVSANAYGSTNLNTFPQYTPAPAPAPVPANANGVADRNALRLAANYASVIAANPYVPSNPAAPVNTLLPANPIIPSNTLLSANSVVAPTNTPLPANTLVPENSNAYAVPNAVRPWATGLTFQEEIDPERRAKMLEIAQVTHMLLNSRNTLFGAQKAKHIQAARAADEALKKPTKRRTKKDKKGQDNAASNPTPKQDRENNTTRNGNQVHQPASTQSSGKKSGPAIQGNARARNASNPPVLTTTEQHIAQFWRGRRDQSEHSFLCHGSMVKFRPVHELWNTAEVESRSKRYGNELPDEHPKLSEDSPEQPPPKSDMILYTEVMTEGNVERPVHSGQIVVVSYDIKSEWWKNINIWTWQRHPVARCIDEIAVVITPYHIVFGRIPFDQDLSLIQRDWEELIGLIDRLFKIPVVGAEEPTWAVMYRLVPCFAIDKDEAVDNRKDVINPSRAELLNSLGPEAIYHTRFKQHMYYVPPVRDIFFPHNLSIRVGHFGQQGYHDRPHLEIIDFTGRRIIHD